MSKVVQDRELEKACLQQMFVNITSFVVIVCGTFLKLPHLHKVYSTGSVGGLSEASLIPDVWSGLLFTIYNFLLGIPFSLWGEVLIFALQKTVLLLLFWRYTSSRNSMLSKTQRFVVAAGTLGAVAAIATGLVSRWSLSLLGLSPIFFMSLARAPQLLQNYRRQHTGNQEVGIFLNLIVGSIARVGTTVLEIDDLPSLITCSVAVVFHVLAALQILLYRRKTWKVTGEVSKAAKME